MNKKVREKLIEIAKNRDIIFYSDLNIACHLGINLEGDAGGKEIGKILGDISEYELKNKRPPISVLVGLKNTKPFTPSDGFFNLMDELKIRKPKEKNEFLKIRLMNLCYDYWSKH
jgi:hypothetical protein